MLSLFLRNLFFTLLQPGVVAGLIPYWIIGSKAKLIVSQTWGLQNYTGAALFGFGFIILIVCVASFAVYGNGTLSPADQTKRLVIRGLYNYSRNPMYVGVMLMLIGETIFFKSVNLLFYAGLILLAFSVFVRYFEEPRLRKDFGEEYKLYFKKVRRWL